MSIYYLSTLPNQHSNYFLQNKYTKWYFSIISKALTRGLKKPKRTDSNYVYYEAHHILPKCKSMFPQYKSFPKNPWNKVLLTAREHYVCHLLLVKMTNNKAKSSMYNAYTAMSEFNNETHLRKNSHLYTFFKEKWTFLMTGAGNPNFNKRWNDQQRLKMSKRMKNYSPSTETRLKISLNLKGCNWYHNIDGKTIMCKLDNVPEGFYKGRIPTKPKPPKKKNQSTKGKIWCNNGIKNKMFVPNNIPDDYIKGRINISKSKITSTKRVISKEWQTKQSNFMKNNNPNKNGFSESHKKNHKLALKLYHETKLFKTCPHCGLKSKNHSNLTRYHFNNCKLFKCS